MKKQNAYERMKALRERRQFREEGHSPGYIKIKAKTKEEAAIKEQGGAAGGWKAFDENHAQIPTEPNMELRKISKEVLVYEMVKAGYTDLDIKEQTGLSWDEIKRVKAGDRREYQRIIDGRVKERFWEIYQHGREAAENEQL